VSELSETGTNVPKHVVIEGKLTVVYFKRARFFVLYMYNGKDQLDRSCEK
jgi:hypothetical protein